MAAAQTPQEIDRLEKAVAARPNDVPPRVALLNALTSHNVSLSPETVRDLRRQHILWLIEHHPEAANIYAGSQLLLPARGRLADPAGSAEAVALWKGIAARPHVTADVLANAAIYLRALDPVFARALLDAQPADPALSRARGLVDAAAVVGLSGLGQNVQFATSQELRYSERANAARAEIEGSTDANLVGKAGVALASGQIEVPGDPSLADETLAFAERCLRRAIELDPPGAEWKPILGQALRTKANRMLDPQEKTRLLAEALTLVGAPAKSGILQSLVLAEFDAGDDAEAERDANLLLANATKNPNAYSAAETILGRIAAARGDLPEAKLRLRASVLMPNSMKNAAFQPEMTLAQDVYDSGDKDAVLQFLEASRAVWKFDRGRIDRMISFVKNAPAVDLTQLSRQFPGSEVLRRPAPAFTATDRDGKTWTREQLAGKVAALEFGSAPLAEKVARDLGVLFLRVHDDDVKRRFEVLTNPTVIVIDPQGNVSAFRSGQANEQDWRADFDSGLGKGPNPGALPAPKPIANHTEGDRATLSWEPVEYAESYVVEWDPWGEQGWQFDRDKTVRVIPTRDTSAALDFMGFTSLRVARLCHAEIRPGGASLGVGRG